MNFDVIAVQMAARNQKKNHTFGILIFKDIMVIFLWVDNVPQGDRTSYFLSPTPPPKEFDSGGWR